MAEQPIFDTSRLRLCPLDRSYSSAIQRAAGAWGIADSMISLPYPYPIGEADRYVAGQQGRREAGRSIAFAIVEVDTGNFLGLVEVREIDREHSQAELSFWLGVEAWGRGYMSEVLPVVLGYAFEGLGLNRLYAYHMCRNPASGCVLKKSGFVQECLLRQRVWKWGRFEDVLLWAILRQDWQAGLGR